MNDFVSHIESLNKDILGYRLTINTLRAENETLKKFITESKTNTGYARVIEMQNDFTRLRAEVKRLSTALLREREEIVEMLKGYKDFASTGINEVIDVLCHQIKERNNG